MNLSKFNKEKNKLLSAVIITKNKERDLPRALASLRKLVDEIVVVDSGSTDKTVEIAKKFGAKVYKRRFDNFSNQKNYALKKASGDWILFLDADEEISQELAKEIKKAIRNKGFDAYSMPRKNIIFGKFIRYTRWQPELDRHIWLWKRGKGRWLGAVHEEAQVEGRLGKLKNAKIHFQYETVTEFLEMMNKYSEIEAEERVRKGAVFSFFRLFLDPLYNFLVRYFYRLGFLDGWRGFVLSYLVAIYHFEVWIKVWEKQQ